MRQKKNKGTPWHRFNIKRPVLRLKQLILLFGITGAVGGMALNADTLAGVIAGTFSANSGHAGYSIQLQTPPGIQGLQPQLAVSYSSGSTQSGLMGVGFNLNGLSSITRCGATIANDGYTGGVKFNTNDRLCMDGQYLKHQGGGYWDRSKQYRLLLENFSKVVSGGSCGNGHCWFYVYTKNGNRLTYGGTSASRVISSGRSEVRVWALNQVRDRHGNLMNISYTKRGGQALPTQISYTNRKVVFSYRTRTDVSRGYENGAEFYLDRLLSQADMYVNGSVYKNYQFTYDFGQRTGKARLRKITECDGNGTCLEPTNFNWSDSTFDATFNITTPSGGQYQDNLRFDPGANIIPGDFNGDGKTDFIRQEKGDRDNDANNTFNVYMSRGNGQFDVITPRGDQYQSWLRFDAGANIIPGDYNGDGKTDFIRQEKGGWDDDTSNTFNVYFSRGDGYFNIVTPSGDQYQDQLRFDHGANIIPGDFNGDGKTDFIRQEKGGWDNDTVNSFNVYLSRGDGHFDVITPGGDQYQHWLRFDHGANIIPGDYNGDGKTDFIRQEKGGNDDDTNLTFNVYFSRGNGHFDIVTPNGSRYQDDLRFDPGANIIPGDYNGDGKTDFIRQEKGGRDDDTNNSFNVYLSKGNGYFQIITPGGGQYQSDLRFDPGAKIIPADFNGDGKTDFIRQEKGGYDDDTVNSFNIYISRGNGYFNIKTPAGDSYQSSLRNDPGANLIPGDYNGDGKMDFIRQEKGDWDNDSGNTFNVYFNKGNQADLLLSIEEGTDIRHEMSYRPMTDSTVYNGSSHNSSTTRDFKGPVYLLHSYRKKTQGSGPSTYVSYKYTDARLDKRGRGFLGFRRIESHHHYLGMMFQKKFHTHFPLNGRAHETLRIRKSDNRIMRKYQAFWRSTTTDAGTHLLTKYYERNYDYESNGGTQKSRHITFDSYGNQSLILNHRDVSHTGDNMYVCNVFENDTGSWKLGLLKETTSAGHCSYNASANSCSCSNILKKERFSHDSAGRINQRSAWVNTNNSWLTTVYTYSSQGNMTSARQPTGSITEYEYETTYNTYPNRVIKDASGARLIEQFTYDARFGAKTRDIDANGNSFRRVLDGFGRLKEVRAPNPSGQETVVLRKSYLRDGSNMVEETSRLLDWNSSTMRRSLAFRDSFGRTYLEVVYGDSSDQDLLVRATYDSKGRMYRKSMPYYRNESAPWVFYYYDDFGRTTRTSFPTGMDTDISYAKATGSCPGAIRERRFTTGDRSVLECQNAQGRVIKRVHADGSVANFTFDLLGRQTGTQNAKSTTSLSFDSLGRKVRGTSTDSGTLDYVYDTTGRLEATLNSLGQRTSMTYDGMGRITKRRNHDQRETVLQYDDNTFANARGNLTRVTEKNRSGVVESIREFSYNTTGKVAVSTLEIQGETYTHRQDYNPMGRGTSLTYPDGSVLKTNANRLGFVKNLKLDGVTMALYSNFTASGHPRDIRYPNGNVTTLDYDSTRRLTYKRTTGKNSSGANATLQELAYTWNDFSEISKIENRLSSGLTQNFSYNKAGYLSAATGVYGAKTYAYDGAGNLTRKDGVTYTYQGQQLRSGSNGLSLTYDTTGRRTRRVKSGVTLDYEYNGAGRLDKVKKNGSVLSSFAYDGLGKRILKKDKDGVESIYVSPHYEITRFPAGRQIHTRYVSGPSGRVAAVTSEFTTVSLHLLKHPGHGLHAGIYNTASLSGLSGFMGDTMLFFISHPQAGLHVKYFLLGLLALGFISLFGFYAFRGASITGLAGKARVALATLLEKQGLMSPGQAEAFAAADTTYFTRRHGKKAVMMPALVFCFLAFFVFNCAEDRPADLRGLFSGYMGTEVLDNGLLHTNLSAALLPGDNGAGYPVPGTYFYHEDQVGSASLITNAQGIETAQVHYKPYGEIYQPASTGYDVFRSKFGGKELDKDTGLHYFNARYYDAEVGRFINADNNIQGGSASHAAALNRYHYSGNNPINYVDPSGNFFLIGLLIATVIGAVVGGAVYGATAENVTVGGVFKAMAIGAFVGAVSFAVGHVAFVAAYGAITAGAASAAAGLGITAGTGLTTAGTMAAGFVAGGIAGAIEGVTASVLGEVLNGNTDGASLANAAKWGAIWGSVTGALSGTRYHAQLRKQYHGKMNGINRHIDNLGDAPLADKARAAWRFRRDAGIAQKLKSYPPAQLFIYARNKYWVKYDSIWGPSFESLVQKGLKSGKSYDQIYTRIISTSSNNSSDLFNHISPVMTGIGSGMRYPVSTTTYLKDE